MTRHLIALAATLAAINTFLIGYPGDILPQWVLLLIGVANAGVGAYAWQLSKPAEEA